MLFALPPVISELFVAQIDYTVPLLQKLKEAVYFPEYHSYHVVYVPWNVDFSCKKTSSKVDVGEKAQPGPE